MIPFYYRVLFVLLIPLSAAAQIDQKGNVVESNSGNRPLKAVQIHALESPVTSSDNNGNFVLSFRTKKEGDLITFLEINKKGFEIVNDRVIQESLVSKNKPITIELAPIGRVEQDKIKYNHISTLFLTKKYEYKLNEIKKLYTNDSSTFEKRKLALNDSLTKELLRANQLSILFSRTNFDTALKEINDAFKCFLRGEIDSALLILNPSQARKQLIEIEFTQKQLSKLKEGFASRVLYSARLFSINFSFDSSFYYYKEYLNAYPDNYEIWTEFTDFIIDFGRPDDGLETYPSINNIAGPAARIYILLNKSSLYELKRQHEKQLDLINDAYSIANKHFSIKHPVFGAIYTALSYYYENKKNYAKAKYWMIKADSNLISDPSFQSINKQILIANNVSSMARFENHLGNYHQAEEFFIKSIFLFEQLVHSDSSLLQQDIECMLKYAAFLEERQKYTDAELIYIILEDMFRALKKQFDNPTRLLRYASYLDNYGNLLSHSSNRLSDALDLYKRSIEIRREAVNTNSTIDWTGLGFVYNNVGTLYLTIFLRDTLKRLNIDSARKYLDYSEIYRRRLFDIDSIAYQGDLSETFYNRAIVEIEAGNYTLCKKYMLSTLQIRRNIIGGMGLNGLNQNIDTERYIDTLSDFIMNFKTIYQFSGEENDLLYLKELFAEANNFIKKINFDSGSIIKNVLRETSLYLQSIH